MPALYFLNAAMLMMLIAKNKTQSVMILLKSFGLV